ncbi:sigma-70 family RNA polymerase sigma factor [Methylophilaceae bacterium]|nr:sigma-70 family RNA polymerase sigma factor [Methylophilaceae bacterium]
MTIEAREIATEVMTLIQGNEKDKNHGFIMYGLHYGPKYGKKKSAFNYGEFMLFAMKHGKLSPDDASEVYQLTTIKIFKKADTLENLKFARTWMYQVLRNTLLDYKKKQKNMDKKKQKHMEYSLDQESDEHSKDENMGNIDYNRKEGYEDRTECIQDKLENFFDVYPDHAAALDYQMDGMDIKSIADVIGRSANATKELLSQARKKIAPSIEECLQIGVR